MLFVFSIIYLGVLNALFVLLHRERARNRNLRNNCFVTNERGHRVRYWSASEQVRAKVEGR